MVIKWIISKLTGGKLVYLQDFDGEVTMSIAYKSPFGYKTCKRYWPLRIHICILNEDGTVLEPNYVKKWMYV